MQTFDRKTAKYDCKVLYQFCFSLLPKRELYYQFLGSCGQVRIIRNVCLRFFTLLASDLFFSFFLFSLFYSFSLRGAVPRG